MKHELFMNYNNMEYSWAFVLRTKGRLLNTFVVSTTVLYVAEKCSCGFI